jgi:4-amino-4-deoxy-L-arabinose transferase-like glycosyltransferase
MEAVELRAPAALTPPPVATFRRYSALIVLFHALLVPHFLLNAAQIVSVRELAFYVPAFLMIVFTTALLILFSLPDSPFSVGLYHSLTARERLFAMFSLATLFLLGIVSAPLALQTHLILDSALVLSLAYPLMYGSIATFTRPRTWLVIAIIGVIAVTLIRIYSLTSFPAADARDESWTFSWALSYIRTGKLSDTLMFGMGDAYYAFPRFFLVMGLWMKAIGIGFWEARLFTFVVAVLTAFFTALAARNWYGKQAGWITALVLFSSLLLIDGARIRHDIGLALSVASSLWLYTEAIKRNNRPLHFAAGLMMGWGMFSHYHASLLGVSMAISLYAPRYFSRHPRRWLPDAGLWLYGVGGLGAAFSVFFLQIYADDLPGFLSVLQGQNKYGNDVLQVSSASLYHVVYVFVRSPIEFILMSLGVWAALRRRKPQDISLILMMILAHLSLGLMASPAIYYYTVPLIPFYLILIGTLFSEGFNLQSLLPTDSLRRSVVMAASFAAVPLLGVTLHTPLTYLLNGNPMRSAPPGAAQWIMDNVASDQLVAGSPYYYFWLHDYPFVADHLHEYVYPQYAGLTQEQIWEQADPDVFIVDEHLHTYLFFKPLVESDYFARHGYHIVAETTDDHSPVYIYERDS